MSGQITSLRKGRNQSSYSVPALKAISDLASAVVTSSNNLIGRNPENKNQWGYTHYQQENLRPLRVTKGCFLSSTLNWAKVNSQIDFNDNIEFTSGDQGLPRFHHKVHKLNFCRTVQCVPPGNENRATHIR